MPQTAFDPITDLAQSALDKYHDWENLGPIKRVVAKFKNATAQPTKKPLATNWYFYGKQQPPRPGDEKPPVKKAVPKKYAGRKQ